MNKVYNKHYFIKWGYEYNGKGGSNGPLYINTLRHHYCDILTEGLDLLTETLETLWTVLDVETELRFLVLSFVNEASELSARSSASSSSLWALRYLDRLMAAISSYNQSRQYYLLVLKLVLTLNLINLSSFWFNPSIFEKNEYIARNQTIHILKKTNTAQEKFTYTKYTHELHTNKLNKLQ